MGETIERYSRACERAEAFRKVVELVELSDLPPPGGVGASRLTWRHTASDQVSYRGVVSRIAAELKMVSFGILKATPDQHPALLYRGGKEVWSEVVADDTDAELLSAVLEQFTERWKEITQ